ncbi:MAG: dehydrogenase, partial [Planctomycetota bacterium]|nr:dehydrogenase [Planctomycetota bacterium]
DMKSGHEGRFWVGTFERGGDAPRGRLTSVPFVLSKPFASFLIAGGSSSDTRAEIVRRDTGAVIAQASGEDVEDMKRVAFDLTPHVGKEVFVRLVDDASGGWGHLNWDDFRLHDVKPVVEVRSAPDAFAHAGLPPEDAARAMTVPPGFRVTLFAGEPDVHQPIAFAIDDRGRLWVAEAYSYPIRVPDDQARDQILIFEDTDGDGKFDSRKVFADRLNLVSGLELGFGGVYVGAAPHLLFIPDKNHDDKPDGPPVVLLDGWGYQDSHETLNSFVWGPDGWLYGCHGVFTHSRVGKPGTPDADRLPINAGIWRYHPTRHVFEVFAEGTSNPWGLAFDRYGDAFETACVIPHLYHMIDGAHYERQAGSDFNPYVYEDIKTIADHRHYVGGNPHAGNGRSADAGGGHAHSGAMIYQGGAWPAEYVGGLFMNNIHGARINHDLLVPQGSGFVGKHAPDFLLANDSWSQIISLKYGPDGQVYFIDWYDRQQCHHTGVNIHDRTNGRIFKLTYGAPEPVKVDLRQMTSPDLLKLLEQPNEWYVSRALRILHERGEDGDARLVALRRSFDAKRPVTRLRNVWALYATAGNDERAAESLAETARILLRLDDDPHVRAWAVRIAVDRLPSRLTVAKKTIGEDECINVAQLPAEFVEHAAKDPSPIVRLALASALQRLPLKQRWAIIEGLVAHSEDAADHNLPLMYWYAFESLAAAEPAQALKIATAAKIPTLLPFTVRRVAALGTPAAFATLV